jgi:hypothetical protein
MLLALQAGLLSKTLPRAIHGIQSYSVYGRIKRNAPIISGGG